MGSPAWLNHQQRLLGEASTHAPVGDFRRSFLLGEAAAAWRRNSTAAGAARRT